MHQRLDEAALGPRGPSIVDTPTTWNHAPVTIETELRRLLTGSPRDDGPCRKLFERFDAGGSGTISLEELQQVVSSWSDPLTSQELASLMKEVDTNQDGEIDYEEFRQFILGLSSFDRHHRSSDFQSAYQKWTQAMHASVGIPVGPATSGETDKVLSRTTINPCIEKMRYEVRGELPMRAQRLAEELNLGQPKNFDQVLFCNIGNPQSVGSPPITFYRQVMALCDCPMLLDNPEAERLFATDALDRARQLVSAMPGGTGAYSHSQGLLNIRQDVADFIARRDGFPAHPSHIFLTNGASAGITMMMQILLAHANDAVLVPIPQYPIYTALIQMLDAKSVGYYLDESAGWDLTRAEIERALAEARAKGLNPRAVVTINPGNPTGQCMDEATLREVVEFCHEHRLVLLADEVYQENTYNSDRPFVSAKKTVRSMGPELDGFELVSFHSTSKGLIGECGRRGGYMELCGIQSDVRAQLFKLACVGLCPNLDGQIMTHLMVCPPQPGDASYDTFTRECQLIRDSLQHKSAKLVEILNQLEGVHSQNVDGAMYAFPNITLPAAAIAAAEQAGTSPDMHYCASLLESTGICTVPGSGFGQKSDTFHLRMTFLPPEDRLISALDRFAAHHADYLERWR